MTRYVVGAVDAFPEGVAVPTHAGTRAIVVVRWAGELFAVRDACPHQSQPFGRAQVRAGLAGDGTVGEIALRSEDPVIVCPWHTWEFRLRDGRCPRDDAKRVRSYRVYVDGDDVVVEA